MGKRRNCSISHLFHNMFNISLTSGVKLHNYLLNVVVRFIVFPTIATLIFRGTDISKCFGESLGIRDNESRLYLLSLPTNAIVLFFVRVTSKCIDKWIQTILLLRCVLRHNRFNRKQTEHLHYTKLKYITCTCVKILRLHGITIAFAAIFYAQLCFWEFCNAGR